MAKLIAVCSKSAKDKPYQFEERQVPLEVEENLKMVMQLPMVENIHCTHNSGGMQDKKFHRDADKFAKKMGLLSRDELAAALLITSKEIFNSMVLENITCVGCRRSIEQMFNRFKDQGLVKALDPLVITTHSELSINPSFLYSAWNMHALFSIQGNKLADILEALPRGKKGSKRCALHSLDSHKSKPTGNWIEVWDALEAPCREEITLVPVASLQVTMDTYLRKHRFCTECKSKVTRAFNILIGEVEPSKEKGYCAHLYDGLRNCPREKHIHLLNDTNFIHKLIMRAEPEISGSRERHAKTIDVAQEEVLTCLGLHIYDRLYKIAQKLREEEQTCHLLFYLGVERLRKAFEVTIESKRDISTLEQVCEEFSEAEKIKQQKKELKKQRRKAKKKGSKSRMLTQHSHDCGCDLADVKDEGNSTIRCPAPELCQCEDEIDVNCNEVGCSSCDPAAEGRNSSGDCVPGRPICDGGYCTSSSPENSEVACTEGICNHDDDNTEFLEDFCGNTICPVCEDEDCSEQEKIDCGQEDNYCQICLEENTCEKVSSDVQYAKFPCILQDMLDRGDYEDSSGIAEEDITKFKKQNYLPQDRKRLRARLHREFNEFCGHGSGRHRHSRHCQRYNVNRCTIEIRKMILK